MISVKRKMYEFMLLEIANNFKMLATAKYSHLHIIFQNIASNNGTFIRVRFIYFISQVISWQAY